MTYVTGLGVDFDTKPLDRSCAATIPLSHDNPCAVVGTDVQFSKEAEAGDSVELVLGRVLTSARPQIANSSRVNNACSFPKEWRGLRREGLPPTGLRHECHR